ncbi:hypothetical protein Hte_009785 [Hypoxylon texense]
MPGMISPGDSRRTPNEPEPTQRQSLPSISEVFSGAKPAHYSPTTPTALGIPSHSLPPPPFGSSLPPRSEPPPEPRPAPSSHEDKFFRYPQRSDVGPPPGPPGPPSSAYGYPEQRDPTKPPEAVPNAGHTNPPPPPQIPYPAGQYPLPPAPISPHHLGTPYPPLDQSRPPLHADEDYGMHRARYDSTLNRHFESWGYQDCLHRIQQLVWSSRTVCNFAEAYHKIAVEQHNGQPIPERLPSDQEVASMLGNVEFMKRSLENLREVVQHSLATEKAREGGRGKGSYEGDDDLSMYGDGMKQPYGLNEVKKRRGVVVIVATESILQSGDEDQMARGHCAMHAASTMLNSRENARWNNALFGQRLWRNEYDPPAISHHSVKCRMSDSKKLEGAS